MMRIFTLNSILILFLLSSCSTLKRGESTGVPLVIDTSAGVQIYDLTMTYKDVEFAGLLLLRSGMQERNRFVLTSHFGMTVFDIETSGNGYKTHYVIPAMNRKRVLYLLWSDFSILMRPDFFKNIKYTYGDEGKLKSLVRKGSITKTEMSFIRYVDGFPNVLEINHPFLKLNIKLKKTENADGVI
ncbi:MAG: hypothetical protein M0R37_01785 [Bacteroidales bacterium]|nr:hypothetical protein [Bacteroidales bacterium]